MTADVVEQQLDENGARQLTTRIQILVRSVQESVNKLGEMITAAYEQRAWTALGYETWDAYVTEEFGQLRLSRDERKDIVVQLRSAGMSTRAIGSAVNASDWTIREDLRGSSQSDQPETVTSLDGRQRPATQPERDISEPDEIVDAEIVDDPEPTAPREPSRRPLTSAAKDAGWDLRKNVEKVERLFADDRFTRNKDEVATHLRGHLTYTIETAQRLLDQLNDGT